MLIFQVILNNSRKIAPQNGQETNQLLQERCYIQLL